MIDTRQRDLLRAIVEEYVKTARPVGSKSLCKKFKCSSATIRNDMAELEKEGFLEKTHTSSGRVPSTKGYQFYVDKIKNLISLNKNDSLKLSYESQNLSNFLNWNRISNEYLKLIKNEL